MTPAVTTKKTPVAVAADHGGREAARARARSLTSLISRNGAVAVLIIVVVFGAILVHSFGKPDNLRNVALAASFIGIIAAGMTFVIICGGIDLSVGSTYALATIISAMYAPRGSFIAVLYAMLAAGLVGLIQGLIIARWRLPAFIVTLAGLTGVRGLVFYITHEGNDHPRIQGRLAFETLGTGSLATIGTPVWIMLVVFAIGWWALNRTPFGQSVQAVGGNQDTMTPCTSPTNPQMTSAPAIAANEPCWAKSALRMTASAYVEPTDRSIPPLMITNVMPAAMIPMNDAASATLRRLSADPNDGTVKVPATTTTARTATAPLRDTNEVRERRRSAAARVPALSATVVTTVAASAWSAAR